MFNKIIFTCCLLLYVSASMAQNRDNRDGSYPPDTRQQINAPETIDTTTKKGFDKHKLVFGGNIGLLFGTETYIELSPLIGYRFTDRFTAGLGPKFQYTSINYPGYPNYSDYIYGGRIFGQYKLYQNLVAHAEFEYVNTSYLAYNPQISDYVQQRNYVPGLLIGGGYRQPLGEHSALILYVLYNVMYQDGISPYPSPLVITGGFLF